MDDSIGDNWKDINDVDDAIALELVEEFGFEARCKTQWGKRQYEADVNSFNLSWWYDKNGTALQFELTMPTNHIYREYFYITSEALIYYFDDEFVPWILNALWDYEELILSQTLQ